MRLLKLQLTILGTVGLLIALSTLIFSIILSLLGGAFNIGFLLVLVIFFNLIQWYYAPKIIERMYKVREIKQTENIGRTNGKWVYDTVKRICESTKMPMPKIMYSGIAIPNAFAYGSPKYGNRIAITQGMFDRLENEEIEAVIGHEIGHLKHKDVQVMMLASLLPSLLSTIGHSLIWSSMFNRRNSGGTMGIAFAAIIGSFILSLVCRSLGRTRESYADMHAVQHVPDGRRKLQEGLAKISEFTEELRVKKHKDMKVSGFNALMISDPDSSHKDIVSLHRSRIKISDRELVEKYAKKEISFKEHFLELFSTHPNITKRLNALGKK